MPLTDSNATPGTLPSLLYDRTAASKFVIDFKHYSPVKLQFPPKITADSKAARWDESHHHGFEEYAKFFGSYARKVNIELNYVVWGTWDQSAIADEVRKIKWHLYVGGGSNAVGDKMPFFFIRGWKIIDGTKKPPPFRLMDVSVDYSREHVGSGDDYWPLHTKVNMSCKMFTGTGSKPGEGYWLKLSGYDCGDLPGEAFTDWA